MATILVLIWLFLLPGRTEKANQQDRDRIYDNLSPEDAHYILLIHIRQDIALICNLLMPIILLLAVIADALLFKTYIH